MALDKRIFRQADFIQVSVNNVTRALVEGIVLVIVVVLVFLGNSRATFITVTAIPLSLVAAVLTLKAFGATINTMTLGGMAIAIGALVDDAVIDVENVFRRLRENALLPQERRRSAFAVVLTASVEIRVPSFLPRSSSRSCLFRFSSSPASRGGCCNRSASPTLSPCSRRCWSR